MHRAKASASLTSDDDPDVLAECVTCVVVEPSCATPLPDGPPHAASTSEKVDATTRAGTVRKKGLGLGMMPIFSLKVSSSESGDGTAR
jgi:hypothetical protein